MTLTQNSCRRGGLSCRGGYGGTGSVTARAGPLRRTAELSAIVAVGNLGRGAVGPCGRDRQVLFDYHPRIRVILPTPQGVRSVRITDLMPLGAVCTPDEGTREFNPSIFEDAPEGQ